MAPIRLILVPVDFSAHSQQALEFAIGLARRLNAKLRLFHAWHLPIGVDYDLSLPGDLLPAVRNAAATRLEEVVGKATAEGVEATGEIAEGPAARAIADEAKRTGADLIVMGTHGRTGITHALLGSVAERTLRLAPCSVLTVPLPE